MNRGNTPDNQTLKAITNTRDQLTGGSEFERVEIDWALRHGRCRAIVPHLRNHITCSEQERARVEMKRCKEKRGESTSKTSASEKADEKNKRSNFENLNDKQHFQTPVHSPRRRQWRRSRFHVRICSQQPDANGLNLSNSNSRPTIWPRVQTSLIFSP